MNLIEELGLEKCKAIVDGAPRGAEKWRDMDSVCHSEEILYYAKGPHFWVVWAVEKKCWVVSVIHEGDEYILDQLQDLKDLRSAISNHSVTPTDMVTDIRNHIIPLTEVIER